MPGAGAVPGGAVPRHRHRDGQMAGALPVPVWAARAGRDCSGCVGRGWEPAPAVTHCRAGGGRPVPAPSAAPQSCCLPAAACGNAAGAAVHGKVRGRVG